MSNINNLVILIDYTCQLGPLITIQICIKKSLTMTITMRVVNVFVGNTNVAMYSEKISRLPF